MQTAIGYTRVSTAEQQRSGLGLEAQRTAIEAFAATEGLQLVAWYSDAETGKGSNALERRPGLAAALKAARASRAPVLVAKLDRLSRDVHFISGLMAHRVEFVVTELGRQVDPFVLHVFAALAEKERSLIAQRTREGLQAARRNGKPLGMRAKSQVEIARISRAGGNASRAAALQRLEVLRAEIELALKDGRPLRAAADMLNARGIESPRGGRWHGPSLLKAARRLSLR